MPSGIMEEQMVGCDGLPPYLCTDMQVHRIYHAIGESCPCCPWFGSPWGNSIQGHTGVEGEPGLPRPQPWPEPQEQ